ncbi:hypothetical protein PAPYR_3796 [Paratrimastix pyriformis]|uniref:VPS37 C-terminal domain-containing protein n=1 Tax=Paratrimastix pyriformis TaxID=342808 RepID=A0ABQ8ULK5_9EUKA|nr:hypothetical protein PAPYR_3796 [Paratrimastix pyriformis]
MAFYAQPAQYAQARQRQISALLAGGFNIRTVNSSTYDMPITIAKNGCSFSIRIFFPDRFPQDRPTFSVPANLLHPWVSPAHEIAGSPKIQQWSIHSDVTLVLREIIANYAALDAASAPDAPFPAPAPAARAGDPARPAERLPEIQSLGASELQHTLSNEESFEAFFSSLDYVRSAQRVIDDGRATCRQLADKNLQAEEAAKALEQEVARLREAQDAQKRAFAEQSALYTAAVEKLGPAHLVSRLQAQGHEAEGACKRLAQQLRDHEIQDKQFMRQYIDSRTAFYRSAALAQRVATEGPRPAPAPPVAPAPPTNPPGMPFMMPAPMSM